MDPKDSVIMKLHFLSTAKVEIWGQLFEINDISCFVKILIFTNTLLYKMIGYLIM